jgi:hypothetical protein
MAVYFSDSNCAAWSGGHARKARGLETSSSGRGAAGHVNSRERMSDSSAPQIKHRLCRAGQRSPQSVLRDRSRDSWALHEVLEDMAAPDAHGSDAGGNLTKQGAPVRQWKPATPSPLLVESSPSGIEARRGQYPLVASGDSFRGPWISGPFARGRLRVLPGRTVPHLFLAR